MKFVQLLALVLAECSAHMSKKFGKSDIGLTPYASFLRSASVTECILEDLELPNVQITFLVDASLPRDSNWPKIQYQLTKHIMQLAKNKYTVEFALASYNSWSELHNCYNLLQQFTPDSSKILSKLDNLGEEVNFDIHGDCSLTMALLLTVTDKNLKWDHSLFTLTKTAYRKAVIAFPLKVSKLEHENQDDRNEASGDGSDSCTRSKPPGQELLDRVMDEQNVFLVVGGYEVSGKPEDHLRNFYSQVLPMDCSFGAFYNYGNHNTGFKGYKPEDVDSIDFEGNARDLFENVVNEVKLCVWQDPPQYNTLGL